MRHLFILLAYLALGAAQLRADALDDAQPAIGYLRDSLNIGRAVKELNEPFFVWRRSAKIEAVKRAARNRRPYRELNEASGVAVAEQYLKDSTEQKVPASLFLSGISHAEGFAELDQLSRDFLAQNPDASVAQLCAYLDSLRAQRAQQQRERKVYDSIQEGRIVGLALEARYSVTLAFKKVSRLDPFANIENQFKEVRQSIPVDKRTYDSWSEEEVLSSNTDILGDDFLAEYQVVVESKDLSYRYLSLNADGSENFIAAEEYQRYASFVAQDAKVPVVVGGKRYLYFLAQNQRGQPLREIKPLRHFVVRVHIENDTFGLDFLKNYRNDILSHEFEYEVPEDRIYSGSEWRSDFNLPAFLLGGRISHLEATVVGRHSFEDRDFVRAVLPNGTSIIISRKQLLEGPKGLVIP